MAFEWGPLQGQFWQIISTEFERVIVTVFPDSLIHFLDKKVSADGTNIYRKETQWVKSLFHRAFMICSTKTFFNNQIELIKSFMSWNGYPMSIRNFLIRKLTTKYENSPHPQAMPILRLMKT